MRKECTFEDAANLRKQIVLNSLYLSDYENSLGVDRIAASNFFDGFVDYIMELADEDGVEVDSFNFIDVLKRYDTNDNLRNWWNCFDVCPLFIEMAEEDEAA